MIQLTYKQAMEFEFVRTMRKLATTPMQTHTAYSIKKITDALMSARKKVASEWETDILAIYAKKDEKGEVIRSKEDPERFEILEDKLSEFKAKQEEFGNRVITIERAKLTLSDLASVQLSAAELTALEPLYTENGQDAQADVIPIKA
jgi:DNA-binding protein H-NS